MTRAGKRFAAILALAICGASAIVVSGEHRLLTSVAGLTVPAPLHVQVASSITKQKWLTAAAEAFAAHGEKTAAGQPIVIDVTGVLSGDSMEAILDGRLKPTAWSPGEENWVSELSDSWKRKTGHAPMSAACKPTVYAPLGIALWKPMAEALGWPEKKISWKALIDLAGDPEGWGRYGHPEWGRLKLGYSHPQYSSAGLLFMATAIHAVLGSSGPLTADAVYRPEVGRALDTLARNTNKYGLSSAELLNQMALNGPEFLHAVSAFEQAVVQMNVERGKELRWPLAFVFPEEGTYWSDHPYCVLDGMPWVSSEQADAARRFGDFLLAREQQAGASLNYVRPIDPAAAVGEPLSIANGTDSQAHFDAATSLAIPESAVSAAIIDAFLSTKRKSSVMLVLDTSGSMNGEAIVSATEATRQFLGRLAPQDRVGLLTFSDSVRPVAAMAPVAKIGEPLAAQVLNLVAGGGTDLHTAVCEGVARLKAEQKKDAANGENRLYGMVLLSDGADSIGAISEGRMFATCLPTGAEQAGIKVFTIAFGKDANADVLQRIAQVSHGASFTADNQSVASAYLKISAEQ